MLTRALSGGTAWTRSVPPLLGSTALVLLLADAAPLKAQPRLPEPGRSLVVDGADIISPAKEQHLSDGLAGFLQTQQRQVAVVTVPDLQGHDIADYGYRLGRLWGLGDSRNDDGAILIVAPNEMKVRIEVGDRVRPVLNDQIADEIIETWVLPTFRQGDMDNGILNGAGSILIHLELPPEEAAALAEQARLEQEGARESEGFPWAGLALLVLLFFFGSFFRAAGGLFGAAVGAVTLLGRSGGSSGGGGFGGFAGGGSGFNGGGAGGRW